MSDEIKKLLARLVGCSDRIKAAYLDPSITEADVDTLNELKAQCDLYQVAINGSAAEFNKESFATVNDWCHLIETKIASPKE